VGGNGGNGATNAVVTCEVERSQRIANPNFQGDLKERANALKRRAEDAIGAM
jgi:hypothetical protein